MPRNISHTPSSLSRGERWLYLVGFPAGHGAVDSPFGAMWVLSPAIAIGLGLSPSQIGLVFTIKAMVAGLTHMPAGLVGDTKWRNVFLLSTFWWVSISYIAASLIGNYGLFILFTALGAAGAAAWHPVAMGILAEKMPDRKSFVFGLHFVGGSVTEILAPLCVGLLLVTMEWQNVMQITVLPTMLIGISFLWAIRYSNQYAHAVLKRKDIPEIWRLIKTHVKFSALAVLALHSMAIMGVFAMVPLYLETDLHMRPSQTGGLFSLMILMGGIGAILLGRLGDTKYQNRIIVVALILATCSTIIFVISPYFTVKFLGLSSLGFMLIGLRPILLARVLGTTKERQTTLIGIIMAGGEILGSFGSLIAGMIGEIDLGLAIIFTAGLTTIATLITVLTIPSFRRLG